MCFHFAKFCTCTFSLTLATTSEVGDDIIPILQTRKLSLREFHTSLNSLVKARSGIWNLNTSLSDFRVCTLHHCALREELNVTTDMALPSRALPWHLEYN